MNIFGVGGAELVLIVIIMLIVAGPKRMIRWAYHIGKYVGKFRILWEQMVDVLQDEVDAAGLDVKLPKEIPTRQNIAKTATEFLKPYTDEVEKSLDDVKNPVQALINETDALVKDTKKQTEKSVDFGSWDEKKETKAEEQTQSEENLSTNGTTDKPESTDGALNFGAWTKPESPGEQIEREA